MYICIYRNTQFLQVIGVGPFICIFSMKANVSSCWSKSQGCWFNPQIWIDFIDLPARHNATDLADSAHFWR